MDIAEFSLPYWKQGDDLQLYLEDTDSIGEALELHAKAMDNAAARLRQLKAEIAGHDVSIFAESHTIEIDGDEELINRLVELDLVDLRPGHDDEEEEQGHVDVIKWQQEGF